MFPSTLSFSVFLTILVQPGSLRFLWDNRTEIRLLIATRFDDGMVRKRSITLSVIPEYLIQATVGTCQGGNNNCRGKRCSATLADV